jgi:flagellar basal body P-ring formation protein FlgA
LSTIFASEKRVHRILLILAALAWNTACAASTSGELREGQLQIALRSEVAVAAGDVRLGDIAILHTRDLSAIRRLVSLPIGRAPAAGAEGIVRQHAIERWLRTQVGIASEQIVWSGSTQTHVRRLAQHLSAAHLERTAEIALLGWLAQRASRYDIQPMAISGDVQLPAGPVTLQVRPFADGADPAQRMVVWVDVQVDGQFVRAVPVSFRVEAYRQGWVATAPIAGGVVLAPGVVQPREVKVTGHSRDEAPRLIPEPGMQLTGWRTTKPVRDGEPITARNAALAPMVARGEWVLLRVRSGQIELERRAQVMQDGDLGQVVQVRSAANSASIAARVTASGQVEATL